MSLVSLQNIDVIANVLNVTVYESTDFCHS